MSDVMRSLFPWHSAAYGLYALWIIMGLYCSNMLYPVAAAVCLLGVLCAFFSTGIVAYLFVANYHRKQDMVEYYLCHFKKPSERKSKGKTAPSENALDDALADMCAASDYVREYYLATQTVPQEVARHVWTRLCFDLTEAGLPTARPFRPNGGPYRQSLETARNTQLKDVYQTARLISRISAVWRHTLRGFLWTSKPPWCPGFSMPSCRTFRPSPILPMDKACGLAIKAAGLPCPAGSCGSAFLCAGCWHI